MIALLIIFLLVFPIFLLLTRRRSSAKGLPPGSLGIPIIGQSLAFLHAIRSNTAEQWLELRARKYDPISKLNLFGKPTIFIHGQAANKLVFSSDSNSISNQQTQAITLILGDRSLLNLTGQDHKRVEMHFCRSWNQNRWRSMWGRLMEKSGSTSSFTGKGRNCLT